MNRQGKFGFEILNNAKALLPWDVSLHVWHLLQGLEGCGDTSEGCGDTRGERVRDPSLPSESKPQSMFCHFHFLWSRCHYFKLVVYCLRWNLKPSLKILKHLENFGLKSRHFCKCSEEILASPVLQEIALND